MRCNATSLTAHRSCAPGHERPATVALVKPGGPAVENLLRWLRRECGAMLAFVVLGPHAGETHTFLVPSLGEAGISSREALDELVHQASTDPEFPHARVLVRTVHVGTPSTLVVAPARVAHRGGAAHGVPDADAGARANTGCDAASDDGPHAMCGVLCGVDQVLDERQVELVAQLAQRFGCHALALCQLDLLRGSRPAGEPVVAAPKSLVGEHGSRNAGTLRAGAPRGSAAAHPDAAQSHRWDPHRVGPWWLVHDVVTGLPSVAQFCSQVGRLLAAEIRATSSLALVLVEVPGERAAPAAARALGAQLRYSDPLARIDRDLFAAAMLLVPGHGCADAVEARLASAARSSLHELSTVRTTHAVAAPGDRRDVDELLRQAIAQLPGRAGAAEPPGGGRGAPPLGSPSAMATS